jgi:uncharacterized membrane protein HdeD (DUF308 family)
MAYREGVIGGCISLFTGAALSWWSFEYLFDGLQMVIYAFGGCLILFGIFGIIVSLRSRPEKHRITPPPEL